MRMGYAVMKMMVIEGYEQERNGSENITGLKFEKECTIFTFRLRITIHLLRGPLLLRFVSGA